MKRTISLLLALCLILSVLPAALAAEPERAGICDTTAWELDAGGTLTIRGSGMMSSGEPDGWKDWAGQARSLVIEPGITGISDAAFENFDCLTQVTLPDTLASIGKGAFRGCTGLTGVELPESLTRLGEAAFSGCTGLTEVVLPQNLEEIGFDPFYGTAYYNDPASWQEDILYNGRYLLEARRTLSGARTIREGTEFIAAGAFYGCDGLTDLTIPESVTRIGDMAFACCAGLTEVTVPAGVTDLGERAFSACTKLEKVTIAAEDLRIGRDAFHDTKLFNTGSNWTSDLLYIGSHLIRARESLFDTCTVKAGTRTIADYAFERCTCLTGIVLPDSLRRIGGGAFDSSTLMRAKLPEGVVSIGDSAFNYCTDLVEVTLPSTLKEIGDRAFRFCDGLEKITVPAGVTAIGSGAFDRCTGLTSVSLAEGLESIGSGAFAHCTGLGEVTLPASVTAIGEAPFNACTGLTAIRVAAGSLNFVSDEKGVLYDRDRTRLLACPGKFTGALALPATVAEIDGGACESCTGITGVRIPAGVTVIRPAAFKGCTGLTDADLGSGTVSVQSGAFADCSALARLTLGSSLVTVGSGAFSGCESLETLSIPGSVVRIGEDAFQNCAGLKKLTVPAGVERIGDAAFEGCTGMTDLTLQEGVRFIGSKAFAECYELANISLPASLAAIGSYAFTNTKLALDESKWENDVLYIGHHLISARETVSGSYAVKDGTLCVTDHAFADCESLTGVTVPGSVKYIGRAAFEGCIGLTDVTLCDGVGEIGQSAFESCIRLASVTVPDSVTAIGAEAFEGCMALTKLTLPAGLTCLASALLRNCTALTTLTVPASVDTLGSGVFYGCTRLAELVFLGDAPRRVGTRVFETAPVTVFYHEGAQGWPTSAWNGRPVRKIVPGSTFTDVPEDKYYAPAVRWAVDNGVTAGKTPLTFAPDAHCTRAEVVTFLWRACGSPAPAGSTNPFADVSTGKFYTEAVLWAVEQGITAGVDATHFAPDRTVTRSQFVTFLYRAKGAPETEGENPFTDVLEDQFYTSAVLWAVETGVTSGVSPTRFAPGDRCTRAQVVAFLYRAYE